MDSQRLSSDSQRLWGSFLAVVDNDLQEVLIFEGYECLTDESAHTEVKGTIEVVLGAEIDEAFINTQHGIFILNIDKRSHS